MQRAAEQAERTIAVLSDNYLEALYTQPEWAAAFRQDPTGEQKTLLPVRVQACKPMGMLSQVVYIDLVGLDQDEAKAALLAGAQRGRVKPATAPAFPAPDTGQTRPEPAFPADQPPTPPKTEPASKATVKGSGAIAQGPGAVAAGQGGLAVGGNVQGDIHIGHPKRDPEEDE
jgi:hypothetical protein